MSICDYKIPWKIFFILGLQRVCKTPNIMIYNSEQCFAMFVEGFWCFMKFYNLWSRKFAFVTERKCYGIPECGKNVFMFNSDLWSHNEDLWIFHASWCLMSCDIYEVVMEPYQFLWQQKLQCFLMSSNVITMFYDSVLSSPNGALSMCMTLHDAT